MYTVKEWSYLLGRMVHVSYTYAREQVIETVQEGRATGRMRFAYDAKGARVYVPWN